MEEPGRATRRAAGRVLRLAAASLGLVLAGSCAPDRGAGGPELEVFALRYGNSRFPEHLLFADAQGGGPRDFAWIFYLVRTGNKRVLIDTGIDDPAYRRRWGIRDFVPAAELLRRVGLTPRAITHVVLTHRHPDHVANLHMFQNARVYLHERTHRALQDDRGSRPLVRALGIGMFTTFRDRIEVLPGLTAFHVGGHTRDSVAVELVHGDERFLFPSDNCPLLENCRGSRASGSVEDGAANLAFVERFADYPGEILTHHDPARFPGRKVAVLRVFDAAEGG